jgi:hypothetical protein
VGEADLTIAGAGGGGASSSCRDRPCKRVEGGRGWAGDERWRRVEILQAAGRGYV